MKKIFAVFISVLLLSACSSTPHRNVAAIDANIADVSKGDFGQFLYHQSLAEENLAELRLIRQYAQEDHYWNISMDSDAASATANALKHKEMAETALNRWHDPCTRHHDICHRLDDHEAWWQHHGGKLFPVAFFDTASSVPKSLQQAEIDKLLHLAKDHPGLSVDVIGYTDTVGSVHYNKLLADRRARAVEQILVKQGLSVATRMHTVDFGKAAGPDNTAEAKNRRVDVRIHRHDDEMHGQRHHHPMR